MKGAFMTLCNCGNRFNCIFGTGDCGMGSKLTAGAKLAKMRKKESVKCHCGEVFERIIHKSNLDPPLCERCRRNAQAKRYRRKKILANHNNKSII
jgi:hypothetical protein